MRPGRIAAAERPPGYPAELERAVTLPDGRQVAVRPIVPADGPDLAAAAAAADEDTLYSRFFTAAPNLGPGRMRHLSAVDYRHRLALVAVDAEGRGVAVARYEGKPGSEDAEIAVVVDRAFRRQGLAAVLLAMLEEAAGARGIRRLVALHLGGNHPAAAMLAAAGYGGGEAEDGVVTLTKDVTGRVTRPAN